MTSITISKTSNLQLPSILRYALRVRVDNKFTIFLAGEVLEILLEKNRVEIKGYDIEALEVAYLLTNHQDVIALFAIILARLVRENNPYVGQYLSSMTSQPHLWNTPLSLVIPLLDENKLRGYRVIVSAHDSPWELLDLVSRNTLDTTLLTQIAYHKNAKLQTQIRLARCGNLAVQMAVGQSPYTPQSVLATLAGICHKDIDFVLCNNPSTPIEYLREFADIEDTHSLQRLAANPSTPLDILEILVEKSSGVCGHVVRNPSSSNAILRQALQYDEEIVLMGIASNPRVSTSILRLLSKSNKQNVAVCSQKALALKSKKVEQNLETIEK